MENYNIAEDYDLWLRLSRINSRFLHIPDFLSKYVWHENCESNSVENMTLEKLEIIENHYSLLIKRNKYDRRFLERKYRRSISVIYFGASRRYYFLKNYSRAKDFSLRAIKTDAFFLKSYLGLILSIIKLRN